MLVTTSFNLINYFIILIEISELYDTTQLRNVDFKDTKWFE